MTMQIASAIANAVKATAERGKMSAMIIPIAAISDKPTNGWRGAFRNFIHRLFAYSALAKQAANVRLRLSEAFQEGKRPTLNIQHRTLNFLNWTFALRVERWPSKTCLSGFWTWHEKHWTSAVF